MEIEAVELGLAGPAGADVVQLRLVADAPDASAGAGAEGDAALDGGAEEAGQHGRGLAEGIGQRAVIFRLELAAGAQPSIARADGGEDLRHVLIAGRGRGVKGERPWPSFAEDAVQHQRMEVDIQIGGRSRSEDAPAIFDRVRALAAAAAGAPTLWPVAAGMSKGRKRPPRLTEAWFC